MKITILKLEVKRTGLAEWSVEIGYCVQDLGKKALSPKYKGIS